tara:strand:+ start:4257 stop:4664 length:408 start_codon:yes stop_codon:yes gene_type:complete
MRATHGSALNLRSQIETHPHTEQVARLQQECDPVFARVDKLLALLNKSKLLHILYLLNAKQRPMRFTELKQLVDSSSTTVSRRLEELEKNGLITRRVVDTFPKTVEYGMTEDARCLAPTIQSMYDWIVERDVALV